VSERSERTSGHDVDRHIERLARDGYTIVEDAFDAAAANALNNDVDRVEAVLKVKPSDNTFEGLATKRVYNLLAHGMVYEQVPVHPLVLALMHHMLGDGCLVSSVSSITIGPGETAQPIHADDQVIPMPKPHAACTANSMWALTDFTEANGATRVVPGSHVATESPVYGQHYDSVACAMPTGSILVWHGSLWHGGGANATATARRGIAMNYCAGWIRQQENQQLGIPLKVARRFSPALQELCGFGVYRGLIGHIDRKSPAMLLDPLRKFKMLWDRT
jgi:ectoine hydroxylase-related dioxygenase (phytanoyl-CoA dioxygenase family)